MAKLSIGQKADRVLKLLMGLRNARISELLKQYGFTEKDRTQGWMLLKALTDGRLAERGPTRQDPALIRLLDEWENRWFPIASASLKNRFPEAHEWLFLNLTQTEGNAVVISVSTFVDRLGKLATEPSLEARGAEARELLTQRGLNAATMQVATTMLSALDATAPSGPTSVVDPEQAAQAEQAMWTWYLEWGEIARVAITDRRLLRELGFLSYQKPVSDETEPEDAQDAEA